MLQVTGHAGGVPIASPRGRSVEVPFERELNNIHTLEYRSEALCNNRELLLLLFGAFILDLDE